MKGEEGKGGDEEGGAKRIGGHARVETGGEAWEGIQEGREGEVGTLRGSAGITLKGVWEGGGERRGEGREGYVLVVVERRDELERRWQGGSDGGRAEERE